MFNKSVDRMTLRSNSIKSENDFWEDIEPKMNLYAQLHDFSRKQDTEDLHPDDHESPHAHDQKAETAPA